MVKSCTGGFFKCKKVFLRGRGGKAGGLDAIALLSPSHRPPRVSIPFP